jgi:hypothetical protein
LKRLKVSKKILSLTLFGIFLFVFGVFSAPMNVLAQEDPGAPTVTGTPSGVMASVRQGQPEVPNVRSGPGRFYPKIGLLLPGQQVPVKGKSAGGDWILISYPGVTGGEGWVYSPYVQLTPGEIPIIEPPPTPTPLVTPTINATLAAQFVITSVPTRMDTFTPAPPVAIPTFVDESANFTPGGVPIGLVILAIAGLGITVGVWAVIQQR